MPGPSYDAARAAVAQAETSVRIAQLRIDELQARPRAEDVEAGQATVNAAQAKLEAAEAQLMRAQYLLEAARAGLREAQAQLDLVESSATTEQIAMAQAQVSSVQAAVQALVIQRDRMRLRAPMKGLVLERTVNVGEMVMRGSAVFRLADLDRVKLTVYVRETDIGAVQWGQAVHVTVDSYPGRLFPGRVVHIASRAEFIPSSIQTQDQRVGQVFAVKIELPNPDHALKPGMPADAIMESLG
jgi:multidrug resistance efflux pump